MRNRVWVADIHSAVRQDRSEKRSDNALCLVGPPHRAVADVECTLAESSVEDDENCSTVPSLAAILEVAPADPIAATQSED